MCVCKVCITSYTVPTIYGISDAVFDMLSILHLYITCYITCDVWPVLMYLMFVTFYVFSYFVNIRLVSTVRFDVMCDAFRLP